MVSKLGKGRFRWNGYFGPSDVAALEHLRQANGHRMAADSLRCAIMAQAERDRLVETPKKLAVIYRRHLPYSAKDAESVATANDLSEITRPRLAEAKAMHRVFYWLSDPEMECLRSIAVAHGLRGTAEAVRFSVRVQAELAGFKGVDSRD